MRRWTQKDIEWSQRYLSHFKFGEIGSALSAISEHFKQPITYSALKHAFVSRGLQPPGAYCDGGGSEESHVGSALTSLFEDLGERAELDARTEEKCSDDGELERILIVPDCHHPYVNDVAWRVLLASGALFKPHRIIVLGDFGDFYATNRHRKDPNRESQLEHEICACNRAFDQLDALGATHKHFIFGNHSDNLSRYLADHAPALFNMVRVEELFRLKERGWTWTPYGQYYQHGKVYYAHDPAGCGAQAHIRAGVKFGHSIVHGHTHRAASAYFGNATGEKRVCMMAGWLGDNEAATYAHDIGKEHEWMHSFAVGWMESDGVTHLQLVPIINGRACISGEIVKAA